MRKSIPENVSNYFNRYFNLQINGSSIRSPYFINLGGFLKDSVHAGKGSPDEIETLVNSLTKESDPAKVRSLMQSEGIGIECSGFVYNTYNFWLKELDKGELKDYLPKLSILNLRKYLSRKFKPQNSMGANEMTSAPFSTRIDVADVRPGDLIRTRNGKHVILITEVESENNLPKRLYYAQSIRLNADSDKAGNDLRNGVRKGVIELDETLDLGKAKWIDTIESYFDEYTFKGYRELMNKNGIFRPNLPLW